jgi:putative transposase
MKSTKSDIVLHFVWATVKRTPLIRPEMERDLYRLLAAQANDLGIGVLALGGMEDHLHLVARVPTKLSSATIMQKLKGVSAQAFRSRLGDDTAFRWQHGYGVFSLSRTHVTPAIRYVERQKEHHARADLWPLWEETDTESS